MILREEATIQITIYAEFLAHCQNSIFNPIKDDKDKKLWLSNLQVVLVRIESSAQLWLSHWNDLTSDPSPAYHRKLHLRDSGSSSVAEAASCALENQLSPVVVVVVSS